MTSLKHQENAQTVAQPIDFPDAAHVAPATASQPVLKDLNPIYSVKAKLSVCVGGLELSIGELLNARASQVFTLDRSVDQPVDVMLEGSVIARGELVAVDDHFGIRIVELPVNLKAV